MTASTLTNLPIAAGSAVAAAMGRTALWALSHYMRAPLTATGLMALVTLTALAGSNALYFQPHTHPAPFFGPARAAPVAEAAPVAAPAPQPAPERLAVVAPLPAPSAETTCSVAAPAPVIPDAPVGNRDAFAVQKKLTELGLFTGKVDGFYGPMTASAIRAFEERNGFEPTGALTAAIVEAILAADGRGIAPQRPQAAAVPQPAPAATRPANVQQAAAPAQLPALTPVDNAVDIMGNAAAQTIDAIVAAVGNTASDESPAPRPALALGSSTQPLPKPVQVASLEPVTLSKPATPAAPVQQPAQESVQAQAAADAPVAPANDTELVSQIQRGLASLGFYQGSIDGRPGDSTARAIREFENFHSYKLTGEVKPDLVSLLRSAGASI